MAGQNHPDEPNLFEVAEYTREVAPKFTIPPDVDPPAPAEKGEQQSLYTPDVGTLSVAEVVAPPPAAPEAKKQGKKRAFGGFVKPVFYDPHGEHDLRKVTPYEEAWMTSENIGRALFQPPKTATALSVNRIALNWEEHKLLVRYPTRLAQQAYASVLGKDNDELNEEMIAAAKRAIHHELGPRREPMAEHLGKLTTAREDVDRLRKEEENPGFAHQNVDWMNEHIATTWREFQNMMDIMRTQRGWDDAKARRAEAAFIKYLTSGSQRRRVGRWQGMTDLAIGHLKARIGLFTDSIAEVDTILAQYTLPEPEPESEAEKVEASV